MRQVSLHEERGAHDHRMYWILLVDEIPLRMPVWNYRRLFGPICLDSGDITYDHQKAKDWFEELAVSIRRGGN